MAANAAARFPASVFDIVMKCLVWPVIQSSAGLRETATAITLPAVNIRTWRKFKSIRTSPQIVRHTLYAHNIRNNEMSSLICFCKSTRSEKY